MIKRFALVTAVAVGSVTAFVGCATPVDGVDEQVVAQADGLSIAEADESAGKLVVTLRKSGRVITFDLRLGEKMELPTPDAENLGLPTRMNDARILDAAGQAFYMQMGSDEFLDPSWRAPKVEGFDEAGRLADFQVARESADAWRALALPAWAEDLRASAIDIARSFDTILAKDGVTPTQPAPTEPVTGEGALAPKATVAWGTSTVAKWDYKIYEKDAFINGSGFDHSAVLLRGWTSGGSIVYTAVSCNHGACANSTAMTRSCTMTGFRTDDGTHSRYFYNETNTSTSVSSGCSTAYSAVFDNGKHVCNDDTLLQRNAIYYDQSYDRAVGPSGTCSDNTKNYWGPGCH